MSKKMMMLASALAVVAFAALPAVASAGEPQTHCDKGAATCSFTVSGGPIIGGASTLSTPGLSYQGTGISGTGTMGTTTGTLNLTFTGVTEEAFGTKCNSPGAPAGTIVANPLTFHNTYVKEDNKSTPGILFTGSIKGTTANHFAEFECLGGKHTLTADGGVYSDLKSPKCGETGNKAVVDFAIAAKGVQLYKKGTNTGNETFLTDNGTQFAMRVEATVTLNGGETYTLTCV